ncbi:MAG: hypothetical protein MJZ99_05925 [Bacteroidales bacterium]|nr:hypothetical protein [Bacteroidales bacterium]
MSKRRHHRHRRPKFDIKSLPNKDSYTWGIIVAVLAEAITFGLVTLVILMFHRSLTVHARMYVVCFVPSLMLMRHYAKKKDCNETLISIVSVIFLTFVVFMWVMLKFRYIDPFIE